MALFYLKHRLARCLQADRKRSISQSVVPRQDLPCQDHGGLGQGEGSPPSCSPFLDRSRFLCVDSTQDGLSILGADRYTARPVKLRITAGRQNSSSAACYPLVAHTDNLKPACIDETDTCPRFQAQAEGKGCRIVRPARVV